ncbi:MAG TPA: sugar phosphate nucleotidyltransferase [Thermoanaerobaculia bacterium]|jgi:NDP-sugar pyrophosphorylase family protein|nr:sugar phosphate nucleotidyltransferase [Thermoanaerobaculia bacterium]
MKGMILAAGLGTRLRPITHTHPKPMVPLCNRPLVAWAVESLHAAGVHDLIVNLHHLPEAIESYLRSRYDRVELSYEREILGTGGAIRRVRPLLEKEDSFFLVNGDTVQFPRWDALREALGDSIAALTLRHPPENDRFTPVFLAEGRVTGFGAGHGESLMFAGSHLISTRIFEDLPDEEEFGIVNRVYQPLLDSGRETIGGIVDDGLWFDIGTPQRYAAASRALLETMIRGELAPPEGSYVDGDSLVHETATGRATRSIIGERTTIRGEIRDSIVWNDCVIDGIVENCIVAHGMRVEGTHRDEVIV